MILFQRYGEAPIRVVRTSRPEEYGHQRFYDRLGYVYTYSGHVDAGEEDPASSPEVRRRFFLDAAGSCLRMGSNVVICPEGACAATEASPLRFRPGAFRLAGHVRPEPLLVPIAVANFDKKLTRTATAAVVHQPFDCRTSSPTRPTSPPCWHSSTTSCSRAFAAGCGEAAELTGREAD